MYVRIKRQRRTIFLSCEPSDTFSKLKAKVASISSTEPDKVRLLTIVDQINCEDAKTLRDLKIEDGAILALVLPDSSKDGGWESIDIVEPTPDVLQESDSLAETK
ncbi:hypothetical protein GUITHDRAFT_113913 [Guillardia theta CCMP2712]|uniref:Ubiquitin-like domain-containing protein n=1 Tax=Guillardia theta (strain CCMP2712) TaxID=905079 RepID=L1IVQ1_GUITC|nr:hypothetical protein GUITHDRAFT_113913 [Guillardia theta CCMP2712]EKX39920.1 hypothetical protein GUITHDRAFT_113913 [Guillardia theta CCMP2712]|eukprot:XP_005826900.1 hypothetical protein GUITHDRAFT_113913 [Guillardia theta CCMP2712]